MALRLLARTGEATEQLPKDGDALLPGGTVGLHGCNLWDPLIQHLECPPEPDAPRRRRDHRRCGPSVADFLQALDTADPGCPPGFPERFARPLFALIPDLAGQVQRLGIGSECAYVELTIRGTVGGRRISWRVCDRATLREGLVVERESYFDPTPLLRAILTRPRAWPALARGWRRSQRAGADIGGIRCGRHGPRRERSGRPARRAFTDVIAQRLFADCGPSTLENRRSTCYDQGSCRIRRTQGIEIFSGVIQGVIAVPLEMRALSMLLNLPQKLLDCLNVSRGSSGM
jgi:hypothetical protein